MIRGMASGVKRSEAPAMMEMAAVIREWRKKQWKQLRYQLKNRLERQQSHLILLFPTQFLLMVKIQTVEIQRLTAPADYKYVTLPKLSPLAYLTANITDWAKLSLQSGEATLYFENSFVGKSNLNVNQLTDTLTISLGTDNSILVKREKRKDFTSKKVIGANKTETYSFLLTYQK